MAGNESILGTRTISLHVDHAQISNKPDMSQKDNLYPTYHEDQK